MREASQKELEHERQAAQASQNEAEQSPEQMHLRRNNALQLANTLPPCVCCILARSCVGCCPERAASAAARL